MSEPEVMHYRTVEPFELWGRPSPGSPSRWVALVIAACWVVTIGVVVAAPLALASLADERSAPPSWWATIGPAAAVVGFLIAVASWRRVGCALRVAAALPAAQLIAAIAMWAMSASYRGDLPRFDELTPILKQWPIHRTLGVVAIATVGAAWLVTPRGARLPGLVTMALVHLLVLGLWLPLASSPAVEWIGWDSRVEFGPLREVWELHIGHRVTAFLFVPPLALAAVATAIAARRPGWLYRCRIPLAIVLGGWWIIACGSQADGYRYQRVLFGNMLHVLIAACVVAVGSLAVLATAAARRSGRLRRRATNWRRATVSGVNPEVVGLVALAGWFRGLRTTVVRCVVDTAR